MIPITNLDAIRRVQEQIQASRNFVWQIEALQSIVQRVSLPVCIEGIPREVWKSRMLSSIYGQQGETNLEVEDEAMNEQNEESQFSILGLPFGFNNSHVS